MTYQEYETMLVAALQMEAAVVQPLPHADFLNLPRKTQQPHVFVILNGATYSESDWLDVPTMLETIQGEVFVQCNERYGDTGVFAILTAVRERIACLKLPHAKTAIAIDAFKYIAGSTNNWLYSMTFTFARYVMFESRMMEVGGTIKQIKTNMRQP